MWTAPRVRWRAGDAGRFRHNNVERKKLQNYFHPYHSRIKKVVGIICSLRSWRLIETFIFLVPTLAGFRLLLPRFTSFGWKHLWIMIYLWVDMLCMNSSSSLRHLTTLVTFKIESWLLLHIMCRSFLRKKVSLCVYAVTKNLLTFYFSHKNFVFALKLFLFSSLFISRISVTISLKQQYCFS